jgi:tetratricopeptide (TPR) repeat protein
MHMPIMKNFWLLIAVSIWGISVLVHCPSAEASLYPGLTQIFDQANQLYKENKYSEAISAYEKILTQGFENGNIYYNLGNCYFKKGELGRAILNYARAKAYMPADVDLKSNYEYVRSLSGAAGQDAAAKWYIHALDKFFEPVTVNQLAVILAVVYWVIASLFILRIFFRGPRNVYRPLLLACVFLFFIGGISLYRKINYLNKGAIIVSTEAEVTFAPFESATAYFNLTEGSSVEVVEKGGSWYKIMRPDGKTGWVNKSCLELISGF